MFEALAIEGCTVPLDDGDDFETGARHQTRGHTANVSEALYDHACVFGCQAELFERLLRDEQAAAAGGLRAAERTSRTEGFAGDYGR